MEPGDMGGASNPDVANDLKVFAWGWWYSELVPGDAFVLDGQPAKRPARIVKSVTRSVRNIVQITCTNGELFKVDVTNRRDLTQVYRPIRVIERKGLHYGPVTESLAHMKHPSR